MHVLNNRRKLKLITFLADTILIKVIIMLFMAIGQNKKYLKIAPIRKYNVSKYYCQN